MSINIEKMRSKLDRAEGKVARSSDIFWKPEEGESIIRIVPAPDGDPFKEFFFHYNLGANKGFLSPKKNFGEQDPLDDFVRNLFNQGTTDSNKMAKELMARPRYFTAVVVRGQEDKGVKLWGFGKNAYKELLGLVLNPDYGDITHTETGTDLIIKYGKTAGMSFPQTSISPRRRQSALIENDPTGAKTKELLNSYPNYEEIFADARKTPEEVGRMLDEWLAGESEREDIEKFGSRKTPAESSLVDEKLSQLLNNSATF